MSVLLLFITFRTLDWKVFVGSLAVTRNLFVLMKSEILDSYCILGRITGELPLSARVIMASFSLSFVLISWQLSLQGLCCVCDGDYCSLLGCLCARLSFSCKLLGLWGGGV